MVMVRKRTLRSLSLIVQFVFLSWQLTVKIMFVPVGKYVFNFLRLRKFDFLVVTKNQKLFHYTSRVAT